MLFYRNSKLWRKTKSQSRKSNFQIADVIISFQMSSSTTMVSSLALTGKLSIPKTINFTIWIKTIRLITSKKWKITYFTDIFRMSSSTMKESWLAQTGIMLIQKTLFTRGKRQRPRLYKLATMSKNHYFMDIFQMSSSTMKENWLALTGNMLIQRTHIIKARKLMSVWKML